MRLARENRSRRYHEKRNHSSCSSNGTHPGGSVGAKHHDIAESKYEFRYGNEPSRLIQRRHNDERYDTDVECRANEERVNVERFDEKDHDEKKHDEETNGETFTEGNLT